MVDQTTAVHSKHSRESRPGDSTPVGGSLPELREGDLSPFARAAGLSVVEIEIGSRCNRACPYCPVSLNPMPDVPARMADETFVALAQQLRDIRFSGRLSYHLYNEPLLRTDLPRLVSMMDRMVPDALQLLNTNGDLLSDAKHAELREAGIDLFFVTRHSPGAYPERDHQVVQSWCDLTLTNRGGTLLDTVPERSESAPRTPCHAPAEMLIVSVTGDVLLCYEDAGRDHVIGNVTETHVADLWSDARFAAVRRRLVLGDRSVTSMCTQCSNVSHSLPGRSALEEPVLKAFGLTRRQSAVRVLKTRSVRAREMQKQKDEGRCTR